MKNRRAMKSEVGRIVAERRHGEVYVAAADLRAGDIVAVKIPIRGFPPSSDNMTSCSATPLWQKLENIREDGPASWITSPLSCNAPQPETPTESMEFLARSWSVSSMELSKALCNTHVSSNSLGKPVLSSLGPTAQDASPAASKEPLPSKDSPPASPRGSKEKKELHLPHQKLNPEILSNQQLLQNGLYKSLVRERIMGKRLKDQKEKKKQEIRTQNAQIHAAVSVAGVAAAVAAVAATNAMAVEMVEAHQNTPAKATAAVASASALVASHCIEIAEEIGADHIQISAAVNSAINAKTNGDIMALTAAAATALRGAATLRARLQKNYGSTTFSLAEETKEGRDPNILSALNFVCRGGELLKRTRKGALHWKQVSFSINSNWQVVAKLKSKHIGGAFTKMKKYVVYGVCHEISAWPQREREDTVEQRAYFGIKTSERVIEFECENKGDKQIWIYGIQYLLNSHTNMTGFWDNV